MTKKKKKPSTKEEPIENAREETTDEKASQQEETISLELLEYKEKYLRALAENENLRKRMLKEQKDSLKLATENTIAEFLPLIDNFENALRFSKQASQEVQQWATGFQMILNQLRDVLHDHGIVAFHSEGNLFDPHHHEVLEVVETDEYPDGTIIEEFSKGYQSGSRIIRPARVKIAKKIVNKEEDETKSSKDEEENHEQ